MVERKASQKLAGTEADQTTNCEKHLEDFLVANWSQTELAAEYDIFEEEGELVLPVSTPFLSRRFLSWSSNFSNLSREVLDNELFIINYNTQ